MNTARPLLAGVIAASLTDWWMDRPREEAKPASRTHTDPGYVAP